ncbi:hypothetical protein [Bacillus sp. FJAT-27225]|uniref:hypothetical protein n=1 Tax=Bacillus sp. FJAT-27225 TaxID=1743144 RepID=UPI0015863FBE|nr:hypothetical protein [Bacillus sp. FJAT-27225]
MANYKNAEVRFLIMDEADGKQPIYYGNNSVRFEQPVIGPRPPFYTNVRYEQEYPVI